MNMIEQRGKPMKSYGITIIPFISKSVNSKGESQYSSVYSDSKDVHYKKMSKLCYNFKKKHHVEFSWHQGDGHDISFHIFRTDNALINPTVIKEFNKEIKKIGYILSLFYFVPNYRSRSLLIQKNNKSKNMQWYKNVFFFDSHDYKERNVSIGSGFYVWTTEKWRNRNSDTEVFISNMHCRKMIYFDDKKTVDKESSFVNYLKNSKLEQEKKKVEVVNLIKIINGEIFKCN